MQKLERVLLLLTFLVVFFTGCLFFSEHFFPQDGQIFQVVSGLLTAFGGALLMRVKPQTKEEEVARLADAQVGATTTTTTTVETPKDVEAPKEADVK
jgi:hypothetical protein